MEFLEGEIKNTNNLILQQYIKTLLIKTIFDIQNYEIGNIERFKKRIEEDLNINEEKLKTIIEIFSESLRK